MAGRLAAFFKNTWANEPVLVSSFTIEGLTIILPLPLPGPTPNIPS